MFQFAVSIAFTTAAGDATRSRRAYIEAVTEHAERVERTQEAEARQRVTQERLRVARDLQDVVAHQIAVISLNAGERFEPNPTFTGSWLVRGADGDWLIRDTLIDGDSA